MNGTSLNSTTNLTYVKGKVGRMMDDGWADNASSGQVHFEFTGGKEGSQYTFKGIVDFDKVFQKSSIVDVPDAIEHFKDEFMIFYPPSSSKGIQAGSHLLWIFHNYEVDLTWGPRPPMTEPWPRMSVITIASALIVFLRNERTPPLDRRHPMGLQVTHEKYGGTLSMTVVEEATVVARIAGNPLELNGISYPQKGLSAVSCNSAVQQLITWAKRYNKNAKIPNRDCQVFTANGITLRLAIGNLGPSAQSRIKYGELIQVFEAYVQDVERNRKGIWNSVKFLIRRGKLDTGFFELVESNLVRPTWKGKLLSSCLRPEPLTLDRCGAGLIVFDLL